MKLFIFFEKQKSVYDLLELKTKMNDSNFYLNGIYFEVTLLVISTNSI